MRRLWCCVPLTPLKAFLMATDRVGDTSAAEGANVSAAIASAQVYGLSERSISVLIFQPDFCQGTPYRRVWSRFWSRMLTYLTFASTSLHGT